jgi:hypothetical protein
MSSPLRGLFTSCKRVLACGGQSRADQCQAGLRHQPQCGGAAWLGVLTASGLCYGTTWVVSAAAGYEEDDISVLPLSDQHRKQTRVLFGSLDRNGDGTLSTKELIGLTKMTQHHWSEGLRHQKAIRLVESMDSNGDGRVDLNDFENYVARTYQSFAERRHLFSVVAHLEQLEYHLRVVMITSRTLDWQRFTLCDTDTDHFGAEQVFGNGTGDRSLLDHHRAVSSSRDSHLVEVDFVCTSPQPRIAGRTKSSTSPV